MRLKKLTVVFFAVTGLLIPLFAKANTQKPEDFIKQFYAWYITADNGSTPAEMDAKLDNYVAKSTADRIRSDIKRGSLPGGVGYFTKVQDYNPEEWKSSAIIHPALLLSDNVALVTVTFGKTEKTDIVLFLKKNQGRWLIIKADDTLPYP